MAKFNDLPTDIILAILPFVTPDDLESFAMTTRGIYQLSTLACKEHNELKKKYSVFYDLSSGGSMSFTKFLGVVLEDRKIGHYVKKFVANEWCQGWIIMGEHPPPYAEDQMARVRDATCEKFPKVAAGPLFDIKYGDEDPVIALLFSFLPNLQELSWSPGGEQKTRWIDYSLGQIATMKGPEAPLAKLKTVYIDHQDNFDTGLDMVAKFASLPAVQQICANVFHTDTSVKAILGHEVHDSNTTHLSFIKSSIHSKCWVDFLQGFRALRSFKWDRPSQDIDEELSPGNFFDPFWARTALLIHAKDSLENLTILSYSSELRWLGDLRGFRKLQNVHTELRLLMRMGNIESLRWRMDISTNHHSVSDVLPATVRSLSLQITKEIEHDQALPRLLYVWSSKKERMAGFKEIVIVTDQPEVDVSIWETPYTYDSLVRRCAELNVHLSMVYFHKDS